MQVPIFMGFFMHQKTIQVIKNKSPPQEVLEAIVIATTICFQPVPRHQQKLEGETCSNLKQHNQSGFTSQGSGGGRLQRRSIDPAHILHPYLEGRNSHKQTMRGHTIRYRLFLEQKQSPGHLPSVPLCQAVVH
jgi:hypothetical protein